MLTRARSDDSLLQFIMDEREARARARAEWPIRKHSLGAEPPDNLADSTTPEERLAMMWELAVRAWNLSGQKMPSYDRQSMPGRIIRPQ